MRLFELLIIALGLSMDAFAVSICKGLSVPRVGAGHCLTAGLWFGVFQALMPLAGYLLGVQFQALIASIDHWIAFVLLSLIGVNMIRESREEAESESPDFSPRAMLPLAVATSIDALAVGVTFAFLQVRILPAAGFIGCITALLSAAGVYMGNAVGTRFKSGAELLGGVALIAIGVKILLEHLGIFL
jgi:putative Mn2+ efflux pump MntP